MNLLFLFAVVFVCPAILAVWSTRREKNMSDAELEKLWRGRGLPVDIDDRQIGE